VAVIRNLGVNVELMSSMKTRWLRYADWMALPNLSIRSERMLVEQISCNMLFRWLVGLPMDGTVCYH